MASGDSLFICMPQDAIEVEEKATERMRHMGYRGASNPREVFPCLLADNSKDSMVDFPYIPMPSSYNDASGVRCTVIISCDKTSSTADTTWGVGFRRMGDDDEDLDTTSHSYTITNDVSGVPPGTRGNFQYRTIDVDHANMDGVTAGDMFNLRVQKMAGPSNISFVWGVHVEER